MSKQKSVMISNFLQARESFWGRGKTWLLHLLVKADLDCIDMDLEVFGMELIVQQTMSRARDQLGEKWICLANFLITHT